ncbi:MAG TPA: thioredoxin family protein [Polyangiaceae bacterium]|nr:thioredoxin family protein [Polyangiaceae bacterium]
MATKEITAENFQETVDQGGIVLIDWWAPWCGPCRAFGPIYERVAAKHPDITFGKVNTEDQPSLAMQFKISAIPTLMVIRDKTLLFSQAGMLPERSLEDLIGQAEKLDMSEVKQKLAGKGAPSAVAAG